MAAEIATIMRAASSVSKPLLGVMREENFGKWYREVLAVAGLAEPSAVRGCMVIKPWGYGIWSQIQRQMDDLFQRKKCCENAYFPLFIPVDFFEKEATHVEGFAKECAVVTHYRMKVVDGKMVPDEQAVLGKPLIVRPTSETIIGDSMKNWIRSWRDLPLKLNQWANVVRWEHRTEPFLRTTEFLWQEGHCAFATKEEAEANAKEMGLVYRTFMTQWCALPVILGEKTPVERFAGADRTYCLEAMMQDGKAVQAGTSHYLGTHFSKAAEISYQDVNTDWRFAHTTSWGVSTRLIGALIMTHSDDDGLRIPPRLAPKHVVIIPSGFKDLEKRDAYIAAIERAFEGIQFAGRDIVVEVDRREMNVGPKKYEWIQKGVPIRLEIGAREADGKEITVYRRDWDRQQCVHVPQEDIANYVVQSLGEIQDCYYNQAAGFLDSHINTEIRTLEELQDYYSNEKNVGWVLAKWAGEDDVDAQKAEEELKKNYQVTIRCIPEQQSGTTGTCILTGKPATKDIILGKSY